MTSDPEMKLFVRDNMYKLMYEKGFDELAIKIKKVWYHTPNIYYAKTNTLVI